MRGELIALDLETTGLDVDADSIIEIGAVRLREGAVVEEYTTLVNPGFVIAAETTHITGIHQDDLRNAPLLKAVLPDVSAFVGNAPVIAHNAAFDISFMRRFGTLKTNLPLDTYELASILLPTAPRYSLSALTQLFDIELENAHRALDDARATALLYWELWQKTLALPLNILYEITRAIEPFKWETGLVFQAAHDAVRAETNGAAPTEPVLDAFLPAEAISDALTPDTPETPLDPASIMNAIDSEGAVGQTIASYEERPQQKQMTQAIIEAFNEQTHLYVEAGTGTGKSLAYLLPAVHWATQNQKRVVISTNTINLQDQLYHHDMPVLRDVFAQPFNAAVMKGRGNYLCPRRLSVMRRRQPTSLEDARTFAKILVWLQGTQTGDRSEISLRNPDWFTWSRMSAEDEDCTTHRCESQMAGTCPFYKARKRAEAAHLLITNHALLISDAITENRVLPEYGHLIVDEAHQLEDAITRGMGQRLDQAALLRRLVDIGGVTSGLLGDLLQSARGTLPEKRLLRLEAFIQHVGDAVRAMSISVRHYYSAVAQYVDDSSGPNRYYRLRIDDDERQRAAYNVIRESWATLGEYFQAMIEAMQNLASALTKLEKYEMLGYDDHLNSIAATERKLIEMRTLLAGFSVEPDPNTVYWLHNSDNPEHITVNAAPLHVGDLMDRFVWNKLETAVLTSATLRTANTFDHIKSRLYGDDVQALALGSPFDYKQAALLYLPDDLPAPSDNRYQKTVERGIVELASALEGRVLALFTSYGQLRETAANIAPRLALGNITVYDQATGGSRESLLDSFKSADKAVLLGTRSFWEGIDIPGDDLVALVIVRLPFAVPNDPVFAARSETYSDQFINYAIPDAILRFRQGFGRLIRTSADRGIVTIFDNRVINKSYGASFIESLPECTLQQGPLANLPNAATAWLQQAQPSEDPETS